jgi:hypothetical protein
LSKEQYSAMSEYNYTLWTNNASFSIFEYSDLKSSASAKLHNDDIIINMLSQYWVLTDYHLLHFPNWDDSQMVAEVAECLAYQKWWSVFYDFVNWVFRDQRFDKDYVLSKAEWLWANRTTLTECLNIGFFREKVQKQKALWEYLFSITEIPTVVIRNNNSGRFVILKWQHSLLDYQNAFEGLYK